MLALAYVVKCYTVNVENRVRAPESTVIKAKLNEAKQPEVNPHPLPSSVMERDLLVRSSMEEHCASNAEMKVRIFLSQQIKARSSIVRAGILYVQGCRFESCRANIKNAA